MFSTRQIIEFVEHKTRQHFYLGSCNRLEDMFDEQKRLCARAAIAKQEAALKSPLKDPVSAVVRIIKLADQYPAGNCEMQAVYALACYLILGLNKISILHTQDTLPEGLTEDEKKQYYLDGHCFLQIGEFIHDPHGHEYYPVEEINGGLHQVNRYAGKNPQYKQLYDSHHFAEIKYKIVELRLLDNMVGEFYEFMKFSRPVPKKYEDDGLEKLKKTLIQQANFEGVSSISLCATKIEIGCYFHQNNWLVEAGNFYADAFVVFAKSILRRAPLSVVDFKNYAKVNYFLGELSVQQNDYMHAEQFYRSAWLTKSRVEKAGLVPCEETLSMSIFAKEKLISLQQIASSIDKTDCQLTASL